MIEKIEIQYFRSIYRTTLTEVEAINVLTGKNDVGKSNVLKALNLFFNNCIVEEGDYDFGKNYNFKRLEEVRKDTIKGKQFIQIKITFRRGKQFEKTLPEKFTITKKWNRDSEFPQVSDNIEQQLIKSGKTYNDRVRASLTRYLNKIKYVYVPAIKDKHIFDNMLERLQATVYEKKLANNITFSEIMLSLFKNVVKTTEELSEEFRVATSIESMIATPNAVKELYRTLSIITKSDDNLVRLEDRGDGIQARYIPSILNYIATNVSENYIWGFEEPENSLEYNMARKMAEDFYNVYKANSTIFLTTHSPAFIDLGYKEDGRGFRCYKERETTEVVSFEEAHKLELLEEELGYAYILKEQYEQYKAVVKKIEEMQEKLEKLETEIVLAQKPVLFTEGKTDAKILSVAWEKLYDYDCPFEIKSCNLMQEETAGNVSLAGADMLKKVLCTARYDSEKVIIGMFDNDAAGIKAFGLDNNYGFGEGKKWKEHKNKKGFAFLIPTNEEIQKIAEGQNLSIEFLFKKATLNKEVDGKKLILKPQCMVTSIKGVKMQVKQAADEYWYMSDIDSDTKTDFAYIVVPTLEKEEFVNFKPIFEIILEILEQI
ncbi:MAG: ATP-binding protein [Lachnospiraceae bacterium]|nr:ATP-binding protein [Lachnospiraceae bacterium]